MRLLLSLWLAAAVWSWSVCAAAWPWRVARGDYDNAAVAVWGRDCALLGLIVAALDGADLRAQDGLETLSPLASDADLATFADALVRLVDAPHRAPQPSVLDARPAHAFSILETADLSSKNVNAVRGCLAALGIKPARMQRRANANNSMIVLYTITGGVGALFCILIATGIIRAVCHPERYRVREGADPGAFGAGAGGTLTRAILDTFPIVKFGVPAPPRSADDAGDTDEEKDPNLYEMGVRRRSGAEGGDAEWEVVDRPTSYADAGAGARPSESVSGEGEASTSSSPVRPRARPARAPEPDDAPLPDQIGHETCPICIVDFAAGDDLRVLPCAGAHRFHQACVDPWLLELSTSCPLCRQDFQALQDIITGTSQEALGPGMHPGDPHYGEAGHWERREVPRRASAYGRFSRYLRFALARRRGMRGSRTSEYFENGDAMRPPVSPMLAEPPAAVLASHGAAAVV